jgi:uncharacterized phage protein (TIGR01671 family)
MKREILFRGKRVDNGEWVEGMLFHGYKIVTETITNPKGPYVKSGYDHSKYDYYNVIPETVGQFTGLTDKNGDKIFEGDIIGRSGFFDRVIKSDNVGFIEYSVNNFEQVRRLHPNSFDEYDEITGNIHDNK